MGTQRPLEGEHFLMLDGWQHRRPPGHWQGWLAEQLLERGASVDYLELPDPERPRYADWSATVLDAVRGHERATVVAHGLSVLLWLRMCGDEAIRPDAERPDAAPLAHRAALVAPPAPGQHGGDVSAALPPSVTPRAVATATTDPSILVYSAGDPYLPEGASALYGEPLGLATVEVRDGGHLNQASGFGPWPDMLTWCESGFWPGSATSAGDAITSRFAPSGRRLGIAVIGAGAARDIPLAEAALRAHSLEPERRLANLLPRVGEGALRAEDVVEFGDFYGHEYSVAVVDSALFPGAGDRERIERAYSGSGCAVVWTPPLGSAGASIANATISR
jgi:predicted alpha/beta hydrolase family esterase